MNRSWPIELVPCIGCDYRGVAELRPAPPGELARSFCAQGHEYSLSPEVVRTLRQIVACAERRAS